MKRAEGIHIRIRLLPKELTNTWQDGSRPSLKMEDHLDMNATAHVAPQDVPSAGQVMHIVDIVRMAQLQLTPIFGISTG